MNSNQEVEVATLTPDEDRPEAAVTASVRSGACRECLEKHLLKAEGYAEEMREDASRVWEKKQLLKNLLLAEDHALALGDEEARAAVRAARLASEAGDHALALGLYDRLFDPSCGCRRKAAERTDGGQF